MRTTADECHYIRNLSISRQRKKRLNMQWIFSLMLFYISQVSANGT